MVVVVVVVVTLQLLLLQGAWLLQGDWWADRSEYTRTEHYIASLQKHQCSWWRLCSFVHQHWGLIPLHYIGI